VTVSVISDIII